MAASLRDGIALGGAGDRSGDGEEASPVPVMPWSARFRFPPRESWRSSHAACAASPAAIY